MTTWHAEVGANAGPDRLTPGQIDTLNGRLPGFPVLHHDTGTGKLTLRFQVDTESARAAGDAAYDAARDALQAACGTAPAVTLMRVMSEAEMAADLGAPADIVGYTEIGEILGVTRQRAQQIATSTGTFPKPVATPLAGTFYSRAAVLAFNSAWPRKRTGRPRRSPVEQHDGTTAGQERKRA